MHKFLKRQFRHRKSIRLQTLCVHTRTHSPSSQPSPLPAFSVYEHPQVQMIKSQFYLSFYIIFLSATLSLTRSPFSKLSDMKIMSDFSFLLAKAQVLFFHFAYFNFLYWKCLFSYALSWVITVTFSLLYLYLAKTIIVVFHIIPSILFLNCMMNF